MMPISDYTQKRVIFFPYFLISHHMCISNSICSNSLLCQRRGLGDPGCKDIKGWWDTRYTDGRFPSQYDPR